jgi:tyrosinase-like protein/polyphenol oxidase-like protein
MTIPRIVTFVVLLGLAAACSSEVTIAPAGKAEGRVRQPDDIVALYDEVATFNTSTPEPRTVRLDLNTIVQQSRVTHAVVVPYDNESWYEPKRVALDGTTVTATIEANRDVLVALDLGDVARNNYQILSQLMAAKGLVSSNLRPRLCSQILCAADTFRANTLPDRLPDLQRGAVNFKRVFADADIGSIGRKSTVCEQCLEPATNVLPCFIWGCGEIKWPIKKKIYTRKNIYSLTPGEIDSLRKGVAAMKTRAASDPTSWLYQAKIHALNSGIAQALQDQCQHRQFFFFSWHRMFIYYFERILRKASGDNALTLPYWNYTDVAGQAVLPEPYRTPANNTNPLYNATRSAAYNAGAALPAADVSYANGFALTNFTTPTLGSPSFGGRTVAAPAHFPASGGSGRIEQSPHNNVHNDISGEMATGESPRDPIFWLHHANIDRLWKKWIALGGGRTNPTGDTAWMNQTFTFFDENGAQVNLTGAQVVNTASQLGYRYDDDPLVYWPFFWPFAKAVGAVEATQRVVSSQTIATITQGVKLTDVRQDVRVTLPPPARESLTASRTTNFANERIVLQLQEIQYDQPVGVSYLLFLNLPADAKNPDHTHPNFIGTLGFFGKTEGPGHKGASEGGLAEEYDVTAVLQRLGPTEDLRLSVVPSYPSVPADRKDLQALVAKLKPQGNPRFGKMVLIKQRIE